MIIVYKNYVFKQTLTTDHTVLSCQPQTDNKKALVTIKAQSHSTSEGNIQALGIRLEPKLKGVSHLS